MSHDALPEGPLLLERHLLEVHSSRTAFDRVAALRVEGVSISAIGRVTGHGWNTVARWLERAGVAAGKFNDAKLKGFELIELQLDDLCTFVGGKVDVMWTSSTTCSGAAGSRNCRSSPATASSTTVG